MEQGGSEMKYIDGKHHLCGDCKDFYHCDKEIDGIVKHDHKMKEHSIVQLFTTVKQCPKFVPQCDCQNCKYEQRQCNLPYGKDCQTYGVMLERKIRRKYNFEQFTITAKGDRMV
jgi:hypothetical protein